MYLKQFTAMFKARTMEFIRDRGAFLWNLLFPIILVFGFAFAFSGNNDKVYKVGVIGQSEPAPAFMKLEQIDFIRYNTEKDPLEKILTRLRQHQIEMVLDLSEKRYWINGESAKSRLVKKLFVGEMALENPDGTVNEVISVPSFREELVSGKAVRYVDWVVPGVIGMNMMFSCLFGVGFVIVRYRKNGVLKRLKATPVSAMNFVAAQGVSRFLIVISTAIVVFTGTNLLLGFTMNGNYFDLLLISALSIFCLISLGLVFASRFKSEELASGIMNLVIFPMIILSGVFFSLEGAPEILQNFAQILPLTHFIDGARKIMLDGAGLAAVAPDLLILSGLTVLFLSLAAWLFKWE